jgi:glycosyltransferase involved in cell wall biosynthesis
MSMVGTPVISVCMTTYNGERYLREQLDSILSQLGNDTELIISDDSSTDNTLDIIRSFEDSRITLLEGNNFRSPIYNIENALKHAHGDILVLADQDDIWLPGKLELIRGQLTDKTDQPALVMANGHVIDAEGRRTGKTMFQRKRPKKSLAMNIFDNTFTGCALAFTRPLLELALPFPQGIPMHDFWLGCLALVRGEVAFVPDITMEYRRHGANQSYLRLNPLQQIRWRVCIALNLWRRCR